jgi:hypothetical protein
MTALRAKTAKTANAKPAGERDILPPITDGERKNGWSEQTLDAFLRGIFHGDAYNYRREILSRWREAERIAAEQVAKFKREYDLADPSEKRKLTELELAAAHCKAMANRAADQLDGL